MEEEQVKCPPLLLRLFLSVDLVGSTAMKQPTGFTFQSRRDFRFYEELWFDVLEDFFSYFEIFFRTKWDNVWKDARKKIPSDFDFKPTEADPRPTVWKTLGDEVIFTIDILHPVHALIGLHCFSESICNYRKYLKKDTRTRGLDVKGTAWLASFPYNNIEQLQPISENEDLEKILKSQSFQGQESMIKLLMRNIFCEYKLSTGRENFTEYNIDYFGPQIDLGFRISKSATPRKLVISIDLVFLVSYTIKKFKKLKKFEPDLFFDKTEPLKGILSGRPYPIIWSDTKSNSEFDKAEDKIRNQNKLKTNDSFKYSQEFINSCEGISSWSISPVFFIPSEIDQDDGLKNQYNEFEEKWRIANHVVRDILNPRKKLTKPAHRSHDKKKIHDLSKSIDDMIP